MYQTAINAMAVWKQTAELYEDQRPQVCARLFGEDGVVWQFTDFFALNLSLLAEHHRITLADPLRAQLERVEADYARCIALPRTETKLFTVDYLMRRIEPLIHVIE